MTDKDKEWFNTMYTNLNGFEKRYGNIFNRDFSKKLTDAKEAVEDILRVMSTDEENIQRDRVKNYC